MTITTACRYCGENFEAHSFKAEYCRDAHRKAASRERAKQRAEAAAAAATTSDELGENVTDETPLEEPSAPGHEIYEAALAELRAARKERTSQGLAALALARQMDMLVDSPGALPGQMPAQFSAAMARALGGASNPAAGGLADIIGGSGGLVVVRGGRS